VRAVRIVLFSLLAATATSVAAPDDRAPALPTLLTAQELAAKIDARLAAWWQEQGLVPAEPVDDATWLRRTSLDLRGCAPTGDEVEAFLADGAADRRGRTIDRFLADPLHADHLASLWNHLLVDEAGKDAEKTTRWLKPWLATEFAKQRSFADLTRELVASTGAARIPGAFSFPLSYRDSIETLAGVTARAFLGLQIQCAQCHDHPFDDWKQEQFNRFAAFFVEMRGDHGLLSEIGGPGFRVIDRSPEWDLVDRLRKLDEPDPSMKGRGAMREEEGGTMAAAAGRRSPDERAALAELQRLCRETKPGVRAITTFRDDAEKLEALRVRLAPDARELLDRYLDRTTRFATAVQLDGRPAEGLESGARRAALAEWIVAPDNPWFAAAQANRWFGVLFGNGLVEPVDDLTGSDDRILPDLLALLAREFTAHGSDLRFLLGALARTRAYALGPATAADPEERTRAERNFAAHPRRAFTAEQLATTLERATGRGATLAEIDEPRAALLRELSRCSPRRPNDNDRELEANLPLALLLMNGDEAAAPAALREPAAVARLADAAQPAAQRVLPWFLATLSRPPRGDEADALLATLAGVAPDAAAADLFWALVNSAEFHTNP